MAKKPMTRGIYMSCMCHIYMRNLFM